MIIDSRLEFSDAQAVTATAAATNIVALTQARDIGQGSPMWVICQLDVAADAGNSDETYSVGLETDDNASFSSAAVISTFTFTRGDAVGTRKVIGMPYGNERYVRLNYTVGGTSPSMTVSAWLTDQEPESWVSFPDAI